MKLDFRQRLLGTTLLVGASMLATPALAQEAAAEPASEPQSAAADAQSAPEAAAAPAEETRDIVVTGTRIPSANLEAAAPVTVVSSQDLKLQGTTRVEDLLNSLPGVGAAQTSGVSNGANGTATVDLRYLGSKRTLVLVNGRRLTPGDPAAASQAADLNLIPASLVKRAEVLTGGASSVYGADAVAGVVNFILDTKFEGIRFDGQYGVYQHGNDCPSITNGRSACDALDDRIAQGRAGYSYPKGSVVDGGSFDGTVSFGVSFDDDRGHAVGYLGYRNVNAVLQSRRDYSVCSLSGGGDPSCGGSATSGEGNFYNSRFTVHRINADGSVTPNVTSLYNFAPLNYYQRPDERYVAGLFADYEINKAIQPYLEFMFMDDRSVAQIAPSGDFGDTNTLNCDNPWLTGSAYNVICAPNNLVVGYLGNYPLTADRPYGNPVGAPVDFANGYGGTYKRGFMQYLRRNVEGGPRRADFKHTSWRSVLGTRGDLSDVWSYDAYYQYGRTDYSARVENYFSIARLRRALDAIDDPRTPGVVDPICRSALDGTDPNCRPYNPFGTPSADAINYLNVDGTSTGQTSEQIANVNLTGTLGAWGVQTPWSDEGVGVNFGLEYRKESLELNPDQELQAGDLSGSGGATLPVDGSFRVVEAFAEAQVPIIRRSFIEELSIGAGYRRSAYKLVSGRTYDTNTYKFGLEFAPIKDVRFRASYNRAVRAPNIQELFAQQVVGLDGGSDPCAGHAITATEFGCLAQGMTVGQNTPENPASQYNGLLGGNPDLNPEKATTKTVGVVLQPSFIPRLALTIDYWSIGVDGAIQGFGADSILADCKAKSTATFTAPSCLLVNRDPSGSLWLTQGGFVRDLPHNVGGIKTNGFDFNGTYNRRLGDLGTLSLNFNGSYLRKYITDNGLTEPYDCAGFYGTTCSSGAVSSAAPLPRWKHKLRTTLAMKNGIGLSVQWRHTGSVKHERLSDDTSLNGTPPQLGRKIDAYNYFDLASTLDLGDHYRFRLGVNNVFDKEPPLVSSSNGTCPSGPCSGNTYPGSYDALGRYFYAGLTLDF